MRVSSIAGIHPNALAGWLAEWMLEWAEWKLCAKDLTSAKIYDSFEIVIYLKSSRFPASTVKTTWVALRYNSLSKSELIRADSI